ncbi:terpene synthase family protein [Streptomyces roseoverticillatus]|uniref:terpene synthase family protein n=1 Tax=Streptomyces roseoverticillatus TaxID=66429 RepID=UPI0006943315|nr:terpene synthase family protein [Streptomyces roseoverticillatus]
MTTTVRTAPPPTPYGLDGIVVPEVAMPAPPHAPSPHLRAAHAAAEAWLDRFGLCRSAASRRILRRARLPLTATLFYPAASPPVLARLTPWLYWICIMDDEFDDGPDGRDPARCASTLATLLDVLGGRPGRTPAERALADIRLRVQEGRSPGWSRAFRRDVEGWFRTYREDAADRVAHRYPRLDAYPRQRAHAFGAYVMLSLAEPGAGVDLPEAVRRLPALRDLRHAAAEYLGLHNDFWSVGKEREAGAFHNAVILIGHHERVGLQEAVDRCAGMLDVRARRMVAAQQDLPGRLDAAGVTGRTKADALKCATAYWHVVRGAHDYYRQVDRYTRADPGPKDGLAPPHGLFTGR